MNIHRYYTLTIYRYRKISTPKREINNTSTKPNESKDQNEQRKRHVEKPKPKKKQINTALLFEQQLKNTQSFPHAALEPGLQTRIQLLFEELDRRKIKPNADLLSSLASATAQNLEAANYLRKVFDQKSITPPPSAKVAHMIAQMCSGNPHDCIGALSALEKEGNIRDSATYQLFVSKLCEYDTEESAQFAYLLLMAVRRHFLLDWKICSLVARTLFKHGLSSDAAHVVHSMFLCNQHIPLSLVLLSLPLLSPAVSLDIAQRSIRKVTRQDQFPHLHLVSSSNELQSQIELLREQLAFLQNTLDSSP